MRKRLLSGTACAALCLVAFSGAARSATLDDVVARLDALERNNAKLAKENAKLREQVNHIAASKPAPVAAVTPAIKGNPVQHAAVAPSPAPAPEHAVVSIGGAPLYSKAPGGNALDRQHDGDAVRPCRRVRRHLQCRRLRSRHEVRGVEQPDLFRRSGPARPWGLWLPRLGRRRPIRIAGRSRGGSDRARGVRHKGQLHRDGVPVGSHQGRQVRYAVQESDGEVRSVLGDARRL